MGPALLLARLPPNSPRKAPQGQTKNSRCLIHSVSSQVQVQARVHKRFLVCCQIGGYEAENVLRFG